VALPVWTDFMKTATKLPEYRNARDFPEPDGLVTASIQLPQTPPGEPIPLAAASEEIFVQGTEPHGNVAVLSGVKGVFSRILGLGDAAAAKSNVPATPPPPGAAGIPPAAGGQAANTQQAEPEGFKKKPGPVKRFFSLFKHGGSKVKPPADPDNNPVNTGDDPQNQE